jgi:spore germination B3 gerAC like
VKARNILITLLIILLISFAFFNSSSVNTIDDLAYVVAIGFDVGENYALKVSFQINMPSVSKSSSSSKSESSSIINTIDCNNFDAGVNLLNSYLNKNVNMSHCKLLVFSEELAYLGIDNYIYSLKNNIEVRPTCNILISKCSARYFMDNSAPILSQISSKYYGLEVSSEKNTGYTEVITLKDFFNSISDTFKNPSAILGSINGLNSDNVGSNNSDLDDANYTAKESDDNTQKNIENLGLAVFDKGKLVGELSGLEVMSHLMICDRFKSSIVNIPSPFNDQEYIALYIQNCKTKKTVEIVNGSPFISCNLNINVRVLSSSTDANYMNPDNIKLIEDYANSYFKAHIRDYLYKSSVELKSDICGFGKLAVGKFATWDDWVNYDWLHNYGNSFFTVNVDTHLRSSYLVMGTEN